MARQGASPATPAAPAARVQRWARRAAPALYMLGIYLLSSIPGTAVQEPGAATVLFRWVPPAVQNLLHVPLFGVLAVLWLACLGDPRKPTRTAAGAALVLTALYGVADEWHQSFVPGRFASATDCALNALGAALAVALAGCRGRASARACRAAPERARWGSRR